MQDPKRTRIILRLIVIPVLLLMPIIDAPSPEPTSLMMLDNPYVGIDFVLHFLCIVFGYCNYFYLVPRLFYRRSRILYSLIVLVCFGFLVLVPDILSMLPFVPFFPSNEDLQIHTLIQIRHTFFLFMLVLLNGMLMVAEERRRAAEREKVIAEMRYLKAQINPHFLFNSLNSIYAQLMVNCDEAAKSIIKMSNIMRHILNASENVYESVAQTLSILEDYISLQKGRFGDTVQLDFKITGDAQDLRIAPLLLIPFVENAFKYGINPAAQSSIVVHVEIVENKLKFTVVNQDFQHLNLMSGTGIGMNNTQNRLNLLYPQKHKLEVNRVNGKFVVELLITLE